MLQVSLSGNIPLCPIRTTKSLQGGKKKSIQSSAKVCIPLRQTEVEYTAVRPLVCEVLKCYFMEITIVLNVNSGRKKDRIIYFFGTGYKYSLLILKNSNEFPVDFFLMFWIVGVFYQDLVG